MKKDFKFERLAAWMADNNIDARRLSSMLGVTTRQVYNYLQRKCFPSARVVTRLGQITGIPLDVILAVWEKVQ